MSTSVRFKCKQTKEITILLKSAPTLFSQNTSQWKSQPINKTDNKK